VITPTSVPRLAIISNIHQIMNEQVQEHFSCADWLLIPASVRKDIVDILGLTLLSENEQWDNNPILCTTYENADNYLNDLLPRVDKILISSFINGYYIVEGKCLRYVYETLGKRLSAKCGVYYFSIDLWEYLYAYGYYESSQEMRFYCAELDATGNLQEEDRGCVLSCENDAESHIPKVTIEDEQIPNSWFLPLGIMFNLGITDAEIQQVLSKPCSIYMLNSTDAKMIRNIITEKFSL
jgi:hypothetical protein